MLVELAQHLIEDLANARDDMLVSDLIEGRKLIMLQKGVVCGCHGGLLTRTRGKNGF